MKVLVTGSTGFCASHLIPALQRRGYLVRALVLPSEDKARTSAADIEVHIGDICDRPSLDSAMDGVHAVIHLAAAIGVRSSLSHYHAVNVTGTQNVCDAALASHVGRLIHVSSTSVYRQGLGVPVTESFPLIPPADPYAITKAAGDRLVQRMIAEAHLPASIIRLSTIFGPGDHLNFGRIAERLIGGKGIVIGSGQNRVPFTYVGDAVQGLLLALENDRAAGQIYNIVDDRCPTQEHLLGEIAEQLGVRAPRIHFPYRLLYSAGFLAERIAEVTQKSQALITRFGVLMYGADNCFAADKARQELGYAPRLPLSQGISLSAAWYRERHASDGSPRTRSQEKQLDAPHHARSLQYEP